MQCLTLFVSDQELLLTRLRASNDFELRDLEGKVHIVFNFCHHAFLLRLADTERNLLQLASIVANHGQKGCFQFALYHLVLLRVNKFKIVNDMSFFKPMGVDGLEFAILDLNR